MILNRIVVPVLSLLLGAIGFSAARASALPLASPSSVSAQDRDDWQTPPRELRDVQRQGFHDGIEGARKDADNHRRPDVNNRDEYRNPHVPGGDREAYRDGFRRGYEVGVSHLYGGTQQPINQYNQPGYPDRDRYMGQGQGSEIQHRGFEDGMVGARKDMDNHRRPDVNNRDEYRHPNVPHELRDEYREAFRRGYDRYMSEHTGEYDRR